jgi:hypothetical protein
MGQVNEKTEVNKSKGQRLKVYCSQCKGETNHRVLQAVDCTGSEVVGQLDGHPVSMDWSNNYQIIRCQGCNTISFRHISWFSEAEEQIGLDEWTDGTSTYLYPSRSEKTRAIKDYYQVPNTVRRVYRETIECFNNDNSMLCAAGLRAIIEGICADQGVTAGPVQVEKSDGSKQTERRNNLEGKIAGLCEKGILTQSNTVILHELRFLGNDSLHTLNQPSSGELLVAIDIIEHTVDALYELPDKAEELRRMRSKRLKRTEG